MVCVCMNFGFGELSDMWACRKFIKLFNIKEIPKRLMYKILRFTLYIFCIIIE